MNIPSDNSSTVKIKRGRPSSPDSLVFFTVGLTLTQWQWLQLWMPSGSRTDAIRELFIRAMKFWPLGPSVFGHVRKSGGAA